MCSMLSSHAPAPSLIVAERAATRYADFVKSRRRDMAYRENGTSAVTRNRQFGPEAGPNVGPAASLNCIGCLPSVVILLTLNSSGELHISWSASRLPVASALTPSENPLPTLECINGRK